LICVKLYECFSNVCPVSAIDNIERCERFDKTFFEIIFLTEQRQKCYGIKNEYCVISNNILLVPYLKNLFFSKNYKETLLLG